jgi:hypothetical protein
MQHPHWQYFVTLCQDLERVGRFVEFEADNFPTHSTEFARLYLAAGSEIDVVAKLLCKTIDPVAKLKNIDDYRGIILAKYPDFPTVEVVLPHHELSVVPWKEWSSGKNPNWWRIYNDVKHERDLHYKEANLLNAFTAVAGLLVVVGYLYAKETADEQLLPQPEFMAFARKYYRGGSTKMHRYYLLPGAPQPQSYLEAVAQLKAKGMTK